MSFIGELKRRNVFRMAIAYLLVAWLLLQGIDFALEVIDAPGWILQVFVLTAAVGLPIVLIFSWVFELTPEGLKRESQIDRTRSITPYTGRKLDRLIIAALGLAVVVLLADRFLVGPTERAQPAAPDAIAVQSAAERVPNPPDPKPPIVTAVERSVAVLPFAAMSAGEDDAYFADGLTEEILNALAQLPELLVTARTSAFAFKGQDLPVQDIAAQLGVRHIVEGSVRRSGERVRVTAQLIRAEDGFHIWSETYDSTEQDTIAVQEDVAEKIAIAMDVVLDDAKREAMRRAGLRDVPAFIAFQKGAELYERAHGSPDMLRKLSEANEFFEVVLERVPGFVPAWNHHSDLFIHILMNQATGQTLEGADPEDIDKAMEQATADLQAAVRFADDEVERDNAELDLAFITSDWNGMAARIERYLAQDGCDGTNWMDNIAVVAGYAGRLQPRAEEQIQCNPLLSTRWQSAARMNLWAGNPGAALEIARQGAQRAPGPWVYNQLIAALVAQGDFDEAERTVARNLEPGFDALMNRVLIAAARGDLPAAESALLEMDTTLGDDGYFSLMFSAWTGDRERANSLAREIDTHAFGSPALMSVTLWCMCGAPFDIAVTSKFAADLSGSGLPWPPHSPIRFPLKEEGFAAQLAHRP